MENVVDNRTLEVVDNSPIAAVDDRTAPPKKWTIRRREEKTKDQGEKGNFG
jgi:hypothetical protein